MLDNCLLTSEYTMAGEALAHAKFQTSGIQTPHRVPALIIEAEVPKRKPSSFGDPLNESSIC